MTFGHNACWFLRAHWIALIVLMPCIGLSETFSGRVVGVSDGDTLRVLRQMGARREEVRVRLWGVDSPESNQPFGVKAKQYTSELVFSKLVSVEVRDTDQYGRKVGWVTFDGKNEKGEPERRSLNLDLVKAGMAWWYRYFAPKATELSRAENEARTARSGLWSDERPVPPWEWRRPQL